MMQQFCDSQGNPWMIEITIGSIKRVKTLVGVDLLQPMPMESDKDSDERPLMTQLELDPILLVDVMFALCQPQAIAKKVSEEDFGTSMTPEVFQLAATAFWREYENFFHQLGQKPTALMIQKQRQLATRTVESDGILKQIADRLDKEIERAEQEAVQQVTKELKRFECGDASTN